MAGFGPMAGKPWGCGPGSCACNVMTAGAITWWQALARFLLASLWLLPLLYARKFLGLDYKLSLLLGLIFLFLLLLTRLHERYSETVLVYMPASVSTVDANKGEECITRVGISQSRL